MNVFGVETVAMTQSLMVRTNFYIHEVFKFSQSHAALYLCIFYFLKWQAWPSKKITMGCFEVENLQCAAIHYNRTVFIVLISRPKNLFTVHSHHNNLPQSIFNRKWTFCTDKKTTIGSKSVFKSLDKCLSQSQCLCDIVSVKQ